MSRFLKFIVVPFKNVRGNIAPQQMQVAKNQASAEKLAESLSSKYIGVAAYSVAVDDESGDMSDIKMLKQFGEISDITDY